MGKTRFEWWVKIWKLLRDYSLIILCTGADKDGFWELEALCRHFHPTVAMFAQNLRNPSCKHFTDSTLYSVRCTQCTLYIVYLTDLTDSDAKNVSGFQLRPSNFSFESFTFMVTKMYTRWRGKTRGWGRSCLFNYRNTINCCTFQCKRILNFNYTQIRILHCKL